MSRINTFLIFCVSIGGSIYGYNIGAMSGVLLFIKHQMFVSSTMESLFVASFLAGAAIIMPLTGYIADLIGRKKILIISTVVALLSIIYMASAQTIQELILGRILTGIASGMILITTPLYISETIPAHLRGRGTVAFQLFLTFGILLSTIFSLLLDNSENWHYIFVLELIPAIIFIIITSFLSESPRWLLMKNRPKKALQVLLKTHTLNHAKKMLEISHTIEATTQNHSNKYLMLSFLLVIAIAVLNQLTGINSFLQYDSVILSGVGLTKYNTALTGSVVMTAINFLMTVVAIFIADKFERKNILRFGLIGIIICLIIAASAHYFTISSKIQGLIISLALLGFIIFFSLAPGALVWSLISEILPTKIRSIGMSITLFLSSMSGAVLSAVFLPLAGWIGFGGIFLMCAATTLIYFIITFLIPNTKGKTLEEISKNQLIKRQKEI